MIRLKMLACSSSGAGPGVGYMLRLVISGNRVWHPQQQWKLLVDNCLADIENAIKRAQNVADDNWPRIR